MIAAVLPHLFHQSVKIIDVVKEGVFVDLIGKEPVLQFFREPGDTEYLIT